MGFFSGIKKFGKKLLGGVKKVFRKVGEFVGKVFDSKIGKALLTTAAVVTGGIALAAGATKFVGASGFFNKFVQGGKAFASALANPVAGAKSLAPGAAPLSGSSSAAQAAAAKTSAKVGGEGAAQALVQGSASPVDDAALNLLRTGTEGAAAGVGSAAGAGGSAAATAAGQTKGFLARVAEMGGKAAGGAMDFLKTPGGGYFATGALRGFAEGKMMEDERKWNDRFNRMWDDPNQVAPLRAAAARDIGMPTGYLTNMRNAADFQVQTGDPSTFTPRVAFG